MSKKSNETFRSGEIVRFGERLREAMGGQSNTAFAKKCGLSETVIRGYLSGKTYPGIDKLPAIAEACGKPVEWLVTGVSNPSKGNANSLPSQEELENWWQMILKSMSYHELATIVKAYQENGKKALLTDSYGANPTATEPAISQSSLNTAKILEALPDAERREILAKYGITEQGSPVAPGEEPHKRAV